MISNKTYAGIGSRETPQSVLQTMSNIASLLGANEFTLRSGGTGHAMRLAKAHGIPIINLWNTSVDWKAHLNRLLKAILS